MTDNELRAHDIAIASAKIVFEAELLKAKQEHSDLNFDFYAVYMDAYSKVLESLQRDLSDKQMRHPNLALS